LLLAGGIPVLGGRDRSHSGLYINLKSDKIIFLYFLKKFGKA